MSGLIIREARDGDLAEILAIHNHHIVHTFAIWRNEAADLDERRAWIEDRRRNDYPVTVAELNGEVAGYGGYGPFRTGAGYHRTVENSIYVREDRQRRGLGRALMLDLLARATAQDRHVMVAGIGLPNDASMALHAALGFIDCGRIREIGWKFGRWLDLQMMQKIL